MVYSVRETTRGNNCLEATYLPKTGKRDFLKQMCILFKDFHIQNQSEMFMRCILVQGQLYNI